MAIDANNSLFVLTARAQGVSFRRTLTLGRLGLFVPPDLLRTLFADCGVEPIGPEEFFTREKHAFCEGFFQQLGAEEVSSLDFSDYEGATFIHDMNTPVPLALHNRFDVVMDGGTLEHVFNFPMGIHNAMTMTCEGGCLLLDLPANNCCGHGFYQFSPELFFRLFQPDFGFAVERVWIAEDSPFSQPYAVRDPEEVHARVMLVNKVPMHVYIQARRIGQVTPLSAFVRFPAQTDYMHYWSTKTNPTTGVGGMKGDAREGWKESLRRFARRVAPRRYWQYSVRRNAASNHARSRVDNPDFYQPVKIFKNS